jgi:TRAP-type C4-dicarboxylate transport system substrate-binding protein
MNEDFYEGLSDESRDIILGAIEEATAWGDDMVANGQEETYAELKEEGMEVVEPDVAAFREAAKPAIREIASGYNPQVRDYVLSLIE